MTERNDPISLVQRIRRIPGLERWIAAGVLIVTFLAFAPALDHPFLGLDDGVFLVENAAVRGLDGTHLRRILTGTPARVYVPLTSLSFAFEYQAVREHPFLYHLDNILLHVAVTGLVFWLARRWGLSLLAASVAALVFGLHPTRAEAVAWVSSRKDVLYSFCYLLSLHLYQSYLDKRSAPTPASRRKKTKVDRGERAYRWSIVWGLLSVLAKPMAVSLPLVLLLVDWLNRRPRDRRVILDKIPFAALVWPLAGVTWFLNRQALALPTGQGLLVWFWTMVFYLRLFLWPVGLNAAYAVPRPVSLGNIPYALAVLAVPAAAWGLWRLRSRRWVVFAGLYFFLSIFFLLRFGDEGITQPVADRFLYLPSLGFCLLLGTLVEDFARRPWVRGRATVWIGALLVVGAALFDQTFQQTRVWGDERRLWDQAVARSPGSFLAFHNRGCLFLDEGEYDRALADLNRAIELSPRYVYALEKRGLVYYHKREWDKALTDFQWALSLRPDLAGVYNDRGLVYDELNLPQLSLEDFDRALALNPRSAVAYHNRGRLLMKMHRTGEAEADFARALELDPRYTKAYVSRGNLYLAQGDPVRALENYDRALAQDPEFGGAYYNRSVVFYLRQDFYQARDDARMARQFGFPMPPGYLENLEKMLGVSSGVHHNTSQ